MNKIVYNKLVLQAEEARSRGLTKLAENITSSLSKETREYTSIELNDNIKNNLWKLAGQVIEYYNLKSANAEEIDLLLSDFASTLVDGLKDTLHVESADYESETKVPGEK
jgi:hypothetical protein